MFYTIVWMSIMRSLILINGCILGELGDRQAQTQVFSNLAYAYTKVDKYDESITAFQHAIQGAKDSGDRESQCLATEGVAAVWFRIKQYQRAVSSYKQALQLIPKSNKDSPAADRIVEKLTDAIQFQLREEGKEAERSLAKQLAQQSQSKKRRGRSRFSKENHHSLIAKGLEESTTEDSSEEDSECSDDIDGRGNIQNRKKQDTLNGSFRTSKSNRLNRNGTNFNIKTTLPKGHGYDPPKDYDDETPRADKEYFLAGVAQRQALQKEEVSEKEVSSRMCVVM